MRIVVLGSRGQLGAAMVHACREQHEVVALDRAALDLTDADAVTSAIARIRPDAIVNCAAYNAVDAAEDHPVEAMRANAIAVRSLARVAGGAALVHFSSDFVFDGAADRPYVEDDPVNPLGVYAMSKLLGEWFAIEAPRGYVLRVESLFGRAPDAAPAKGSVATIVNALLAGQAPRVFEDRTVSPGYVVDVAVATRTMIEQGLAPGLYHCVNGGACTWLELAREAARLLGIEARFDAVRFADVTFPAPRPRYCALSNAKLAAAGIAMAPWQDALARYLRGVRDDIADQITNRQARSQSR
jgi:dTDP-4-dehydrorhamnose reductase